MISSKSKPRVSRGSWIMSASLPHGAMTQDSNRPFLCNLHLPIVSKTLKSLDKELGGLLGLFKADSSNLSCFLGFLLSLFDDKKQN